MKKSMVIVGVAILSMALVSNVMAQATASQTVSLAVNPVYRISVSGDPAALTISDGTAGTDALTSVSNSATTYSITQNVASTVKITAHVDAVLATGYKLEMSLASGKGASQGTQDISTATSGSAKTMVTGIGLGADAAKAITYTFSADASAGTLGASTRSVTLTLTN